MCRVNIKGRLATLIFCILINKYSLADDAIKLKRMIYEPKVPKPNWNEMERNDHIKHVAESKRIENMLNI